MKKIGKLFIIMLVLIIISIILFITGKKHNIIIENNSSISIKYSIDGENYKALSVNKKTKIFSKGLNNSIYIKNQDGKVMEKNLPAKDIEIFVNEILSNSADWFKEMEN